MRRHWKICAFVLIPLAISYLFFMYVDYIGKTPAELDVIVFCALGLLEAYLALDFTKRWCRSWLVVAVSFAVLYALIVMASTYLTIPSNILSDESFFDISQGRIVIKETPLTFISLLFSFLATPYYLERLGVFHILPSGDFSVVTFIRRSLSPAAFAIGSFILVGVYTSALFFGTIANAVKISISPHIILSRFSKSFFLRNRLAQAVLAVLAVSIVVVIFAVGRGRETVVEIPSDEEHPQPPSQLRSVTWPDGVIELAWEPSPSSNIKDYRIYAGELGESSRFRLAATVPSDQLRWRSPKMELVYFSRSKRWGVQHLSQWFDGNTELRPGQPYLLRVQAVDHTGLESAPVFYESSYAIGGGVSRFDGHTWRIFTAVDGLASNYVHQIVEDSQGHLWFAAGSGVSRYDGENWESFTGESIPFYVSSLVVDAQDNLWSQYYSGVGRYDGKEWHTLTITDGLSSDVVYSMVQDDQGSLWFGTVGGVTQYDGSEWRTFTPQESLADNVVNSVFEDKRHNLWFITRGGVSFYDGEIWKTFTTEDGLASNVVRLIFEDSRGNLWFITNVGVSCYDGQRWQTYTAKDGLAGSYVSSMIEDTDGNLWLGTDEGVSRYDGYRWQTFIPGTEVPIRLKSKEGVQVHAVLRDLSGTLWFAMDNTLANYDGHTWQTFAYPAGFEVSWQPFFFQDTQGHLWLDGWSSIGRYDDRSWRIFTADEIGLYDFGVQAGIEDGQGNIWFGTDKGIAVYDGHSWHSPAVDYILSALKDSQGNLWFGTVDGVIYHDRHGWQIFDTTDGLADNIVYSILEDSHGRLWFATGGGVSCFDGQNWQNFAVEGNLASNDIREVATDKEGNLWFATRGGVSCYDGHAWQSFTTADGLGRNNAEAIDVDGNGNIWVGTFGGGVSRYDGRQWQNFATEDGLANDYVWSIIIDEHGDPWFGTDRGVSHYDGRTWQNFTTADGLTGDSVGSALKDRHGNQWFITGEGVNRYDGQSWQSFTTADGLPAGNVTSVLEDSRGNLWISTVSSTRLIDKVEFPWLALIWALLPLPGIPFVAYTCSHLPSTKVKHLSKRVRRAPELFYSEIHRLLIEESPRVFALLAEEAQQHQQTDLSRVMDAFGSLAYGKASMQDRLGNLVEVLTTAKEYPGGLELRAVYRWLALASQVDTVAKASECGMSITPNPVDGTYMARSSVGNISALPLFLGSHLPEALAAFGKTAETLSKYQQVESLSDKLVNLTDALTKIDGAQSAVEELAEPEKSVIASISARWREVIAQEIANVSGRAKLRAELRTRQILFGKRVALALRVENTGQAVAENVTISLESSGEYEAIGEATVKLAGVSTRRPSDVEFTIHPRREDRVRVDFTITWDDREGQGKSRRFADTVSFVEVEREFTRIPNPYVAGNPITSPKLFFGREDVFEFVLENLVGAEQKNTLVLHGQRRTGKSSVLLQLRDRVLPQEFIPVYVNMEALPDVKIMEAFLARLAYEIGRAARKRGLELEVPMDFGQQPSMTFDRFIDVAEDTLSGQRFVVMFDEFELIESKIAEGMDPGVLNYFRNLMQHRDSLVFVFTGTHRLQEMTHDYWSILFSIALNREISFLEEEDTRRLITEPVQDHLEYDDLTIEKIIRVTHCQPYLVQLICWQLVNYLNGQQRNYATINDVDEVLDQTLVAAEAYFNSIWVQSTSHQRLVLALLTGLLRPGKETTALSEVKKGLADKAVAITGHELIAALNELCRRDVLEEHINGEMRYCFQIDLVRMWVEKNKPLSRVLIEEGL